MSALKFLGEDGFCRLVKMESPSTYLFHPQQLQKYGSNPNLSNAFKSYNHKMFSNTPTSLNKLRYLV